jgi:hypothetical protein
MTDLPRGIGAPATRALDAVGIGSLEQVAGASTAELLALHGVGARAITVLAEALADHGLAALRP